MAPRFIPKSIKQKGLENHLTELGFSYGKFIELMETKATDTYTARALKDEFGNTPSRHSVAKWRQVYVDEQSNV